MLKLLDAAAEFDQPGADRRIGDAFKAARDQLVGKPKTRRDGADVALDVSAVIAWISRVGELNIGPGGSGMRLPGSMPTCSTPFTAEPLLRPATVASGSRMKPANSAATLAFTQSRVLILIELMEPQQDGSEPSDAA